MVRFRRRRLRRCRCSRFPGAWPRRSRDMRAMWQHHAARPIPNMAGTRVDLPLSLGTAVTVLGQKGHHLSELWPLLASMKVPNQRLHFTSRSAPKVRRVVRLCIGRKGNLKSLNYERKTNDHEK